MLSILWNAALPAKQGSDNTYFAGMHTPSDPSYRDDPSRVTGHKHRVSGHSADMKAIFG
ncbi:hypothetical protein GUITHDRAFT_153627 [Guillardia theta CCMP2712]|uniref:Uncharacterized protein n=1 Tax=Guillardia theta (strain CCMP2712) TaxID=905079 RepID=L1J291_GUITC|nr:hypothetical protein GUITHDRAFT_153627 [Guillardia theta CCMP2712]EKX42210.1 hypothetical protein GUITHDRAFT_153627 [Guillardia theta CCMP2712]|eukprot:XP_005829190.1 hypothetical protein GUITHDRAFT_153627 [Guillardia theta CCMP2712]